MKSPKANGTAIIICILALNIFTVSLLTQEQNSIINETIIEFLKGFGFVGEKSGTVNTISALKNTLSKAEHIEDSFNRNIKPFSFGQYLTNGWADTRWRFRKNITILASSITSDLINFPILVNIYDADLRQDAQVSGNDIRFTDSWGNLLDHEIELYDRVYSTTEAHLVTWVKVNLSSSYDTKISMYFGNNEASEYSHSSKVWDNGYIGVWHLRENPVEKIFDSTINDHDGNSIGEMTPNDQIIGKIDGSLAFDGNDDRIDVDQVSSDDWTEITLSAWINIPLIDSCEDRILSKEEGTGNGPYPWTLGIAGGPGLAHLECRLQKDIDTYTEVNSDNFITSNTWHYIAITWDSTTSNHISYGDGEIKDTKINTADTIYNSNGKVIIANIASLTRAFEGKIDEVRVSNVARSNNWIKTEYNNQNNPSGFYNVASKENYDIGDDWALQMFRYRKNITIDCSKIQNTLINFPFLLVINDSDLHDYTQSDADDIRFTDSSGKILAHEVIKFNQNINSTHAQLKTWIKIPLLSSTENTTLVMYYGNNAAQNNENTKDLWNNYMGVWHLDEIVNDEEVTIDVHSDSSINSFSGSQYGNDDIIGQIANAQDFDGLDDFIFMGDQDGLELQQDKSYTISGWFYQDTKTSYDTILAKKADLGNNFPGYVIYINPTSGYLFFQVSDTDNEQYEMRSTSNFTEMVSGWYHIAITFTLQEGYYSDSYWKIYINGIDDNALHTGNSNFLGPDYDNSLNFTLGAESDNDNPFDGKIDEIRIIQEQKSSSWINTSYVNQQNPRSCIASLGIHEEYEYWWKDGSFNYRKDFSINHNQFELPENIISLSDFPLLVSVYENGGYGTKIQTDGDDILFVDSEGCKLDHELVKNNFTHVVAWIKVFDLKLNTSTTYTMYYGNKELKSQECPAAVWDNNYGAVWHLDETSGGLKSIKDSTSNNNHGTDLNGTSLEILGIIEYAVEFSGDLEQSIEVEDDLSLHIVDEITLEAWINPDNVNTWQTIISKMNNQDLDLYLAINDSGTVWVGLNPVHSEWNTQVTITSGSWQHIVCTYNGSNISVYYNGILCDSISASGSLSTITNPLYIGWNTGWRNQVFDGLIDEIRISNKARSPTWLYIEYINQKNFKNFFQSGVEIIFDNIPPNINSFNVEDTGTGVGIFWAGISDTTSSVSSATVKVNNTDYIMNYNGTYWIAYVPVTFLGYYEYQISNSSDNRGNFIDTPSIVKDYTFIEDVIPPNILNVRYTTELNLFVCNVSDIWGKIDKVIINVTTYSIIGFMDNYENYSSNIQGYMNNTLEIPTGSFDFEILVNDTKGNSVTVSDNGYFDKNYPPVIDNITLTPSPLFSNCTLTLEYDYYDQNSHAEQGTQIRWYKNEGGGFNLQPDYNNTKIIPSTALIRDNEWYCTIEPKDSWLFGSLVNSSDEIGVVTVLNTPPNVIISPVAHPEFIVEDQQLTIENDYYAFFDVDNDNDESLIFWYRDNGSGFVQLDDYNNKKVIFSSITQPGDRWYYKICPYDGIDTGTERNSPVIIIESKPIFSRYEIIAENDTEGHFIIEINASDPRNEIVYVKFLVYSNTSAKLDEKIISSPETETQDIWAFDYHLTDYSLLNSELSIIVQAVTEVQYSIIYTITSNFNFTIQISDVVAPRVSDAFFNYDDEIDPTTITFYAEIEEFGSGIYKIMVFYYYLPLNNDGSGSFILEDYDWSQVEMLFYSDNDSFSMYSINVLFHHNHSDIDVIYRIYTEDNNGNTNSSAFDIQDFPQRIIDKRFIHQQHGLPEWILLLGIMLIFIIFIGAVVYVRFIRKPEIRGLDKELVLERINTIHDKEITESLDAHTIGIVVSFFDQRHGPIPIITLPEILKDNWDKLVSLSDRSFSGTQFSENFEMEVVSIYDFLLERDVRVSVMSFGFSLERSEARGGQENITENILINKEIFPVLNQFQEEIQVLVHQTHTIMNKKSSEKEKIIQSINDLRRYITAIILSYQSVYGTIELLEEE